VALLLRNVNEKLPDEKTEKGLEIPFS